MGNHAFVNIPTDYGKSLIFHMFYKTNHAVQALWCHIATAPITFCHEKPIQRAQLDIASRSLISEKKRLADAQTEINEVIFVCIVGCSNSSLDLAVKQIYILDLSKFWEVQVKHYEW